ncbi:isoaspartyl peptidase/L-asparaginase isoform X2 [Ischnura elegans]|uniref:isoaspartyl peptidase/L-asparaginase isoform X2 n=1 Tax=Ischnura elegans TaxID=197161 RepID=UPI001ED8A4C8|nr:isoaspartyl peptidase/L-asparaginase isoform X2 [Ischnura elegans]
MFREMDVISTFFNVFVLILFNLSGSSDCDKNMGRSIILVHGGAGDISEDRVQPKLNGVKEAAREGYRVLIDPNKSVIDAVEIAVKIMEDDEAFNAGRGSVLNLDGEVEMDAIIMEGKNMKIGSVAAVKNISHPISLARLVMENTPHVMLAGPGANKFAAEMGVPMVGSDWLVTDFARESLEKCKRSGELGTFITELSSVPGGVGTVGAVAIDSDGHVAVATSTGGTCGKLPGRVGDTPVPGSGGYCDDNAGAVSTTGHGESIMRHCVAFGIIQKMRLGESAQSATQEVLDAMAKQTGQTAGAITISKDGEIGIYFNSRRMAWAYQQGDCIHSGIDHGDDFIEYA